MKANLLALFTAAIWLLLAPAPAEQHYAEQHYNVTRITITGNKSISTADLMKLIKEHPGERVTDADINADLDAINQALSNAHIAGGVSVKAITTGRSSVIMFTITDNGIRQPQTQTQTLLVAPKLAAQQFNGNHLIPSATLAAADGLQPETDVTDSGLNDAAQAILNNYAKAAPKIYVTVAASTTSIDATHVDVIWQITEAATKPAPIQSSGSNQSQDRPQ